MNVTVITAACSDNGLLPCRRDDDRDTDSDSDNKHGQSKRAT